MAKAVPRLFIHRPSGLSDRVALNGEYCMYEYITMPQNSQISGAMGSMVNSRA